MNVFTCRADVRRFEKKSWELVRKYCYIMELSTLDTSTYNNPDIAGNVRLNAPINGFRVVVSTNAPKWFHEVANGRAIEHAWEYETKQQYRKAKQQLTRGIISACIKHYGYDGWFQDALPF